MIGLLLFAAALLVMQLHVLIMALVGTALGAKIIDYGFSFGPTLFQFKMGQINFKINAIPLGGYVKFTDDFESLASWKQIVTALSGCLALVLVAILLLGFDDGFGKFGRGFSQILWGAFSPLSAGKGLVSALADFGRHQSFAACVGLFASKLAALNLLPIGALNGGAVLIILLKSIMRVAQNLIDQYQFFSLFVYLALGLSWLIALVSFLLS
jgi:membrane-associated protease RseP (regulator of RpoE activity)